MKCLFALFFLCLLALQVAPQVHAADASATVAGLEKISTSMADKVQTLLNQQQHTLGCDGVQVKKAETLSVLQDPVNLRVGLGGHWVVRYSVDSCMGAGYRSVVFDGRRGSVQAQALVPGDTLTDPDLQADVVKSFQLAGARIMPNCNQPVRIRQTTLMARPGTPTSNWAELWIATACGRDIGQRITFVPGKGGTRFALTLPKSGQQPGQQQGQQQ